MNFNGTGALTIPAFNFNNLTISGARTTNNVTLVNGGTIGIAGAFSSSTASFTSGGYVTTGNTVNANGGSSQSSLAAIAYNNLIFSGSGAKSMASGTSVTGNLRITGSATANVAYVSQNLSVGTLTLGTMGTINSTWGHGPGTPPAYKNTTYFSNTTGYLTVGSDTRAAQAALSVTGPATVAYGSTPSIITTGGSGSGAMSYTNDSSTGCTVNASTGVITVTDVTGTCTVTAAKAEDGNYLSATASAFGITLTKATPVITFNAAPAPMFPGPNFSVSATTTNTDSSVINYSYVSGPCTLVSGGTFSPTGVGTCVVQADAPATTNFNAAAPVTQNVTIVAFTLNVTTNAATAVRRTTATLNGTVNASGSSMIVTFEYGITTAYGTTVTAPQSPVTGSTDVAVNYLLTGLTPGTLYHFRAVGQSSSLPTPTYGNDLTFTTSPAGSTTFYVDKTNSSCSDSGPGTLATPYCTISRGAFVADAGDTVQVLHGTYPETVKPSNDGGAGSPITFFVAQGVTVTVSGAAGNSTTGGAFRITQKNYIVIDGFTISHTADSGILLTLSDNITVRNNQVSNSGTLVTAYRDGIALNGTTNSTISNNTTDYNTRDGIRLTNSSDHNTIRDNLVFGNSGQSVDRDAKGIDLIDSQHNTIIHNIVYGNEDSGINLYSGTRLDGSSDNLVIGNLFYTNGDHGIDNNASPRNVIVGNTVQGNVTSGINLEATSPGSTIFNNIVSDNGLNPPSGRKSFNIYVDSTSVGSTTIDFNLYNLTSTSNQIDWNGAPYLSLSSFQSAIHQETNGLQADPLFLAPATPAITAALVVAGDYHLKAGSPAIDSANSDASNEPTLDLDGNPRVDDPLVANTGIGTRAYDDRGAYEYQPPANQVPLVVVATPATVVYGFTSTLSTTGGSGTGAVTYSAGVSTGCSVAGNILSVVDASGTCDVTATKAADYNYNAATSAPLSVTLQKADQATLVVAATPSTVIYGNTSTLSATGGTGTGVVTYSAGASTGCSLAGAVLSVIDASGPCNVTATKAADNNYNLATSAPLSVTLQKADQATLVVVATPSTVIYGSTSILSTTGGSGTGAVTYSTGVSTGCSITGNILSVVDASGSCSVSATMAADNNYNLATSAVLPITLQKADQATLVVIATPSTLVYYSPSTLSTSGGSGTGAVTYDIGASTGCSLAGNILTLVDNLGTCNVTATKAADTNYNIATSAVLPIPLDKADQATLVVVATPGTVIYGNTSTLSTTGGSGTGAVTYSAGISTGCSVTGTTLSVTDASGSCSVTATKATDTFYKAATSAPLSVTLQKADQAALIVAANPTTVVYGFTSTLSATGGTLPGAVTYSAGISTGCSVTGTTLSVIDASGTCSVTASKAGDTNYNPVTSAALPITLQKADQTVLIAVATPPSVVYGFTSTLSTTGGLGTGAVTYDVGASTGCSLAGNILSMVDITGTCSVTATKAADNNYNVKPSAPLTVPLDKADQATLVAVATPATLVYGSTSTLSTTGGSGSGAVTFSAGSSTGCSVAGSILSMIDISGSCSVTATKATDTHYKAATSAPLTVPLDKADQATLVVVATPSTVVYGSTATLSTTGGSGTGAVTFDAGISTGCTVSSGNQLNVALATGTCNVTATKAADVHFKAAVSTPLTVTLQKADQATLVVTATPSTVTYGTTSTLSSTGGSGNGAVTYSAGSSTGCSVTGATLSVTNASGTCSVSATKATDNNYNAKTSAALSVPLVKADQTVTITSLAPTTAAVDGPTYTPTASATSLLPVTITIDASASSVCSISAGVVSFTGAGTCVIDANQAGNSNYNAAAQVQQSFTVFPTGQTITVNLHAPTTADFQSSFTVAATSSSHLPVAYSASGVCSNVDALFAMTSGTGTCTVHYNQAGNANYAAAPEKTEDVTAKKIDQTITVTTSAPVSEAFNSVFTVAATSSSSLPVEYSASGDCSNVGADFTMTSYPGTCTVHYNQPGDNNYKVAPEVTDTTAATPDTTPPSVLSSVPADPNPTSAQTVNFTVTFSEPVVNVDATVFALTTTGAIASPSITNVAGSGAIYTITVDTGTGTGSGTLRLDVNDSNAIQDVVGNPLVAGGYSGGTAYTIDKGLTFADVPYDYSEKLGGVHLSFMEIHPGPVQCRLYRRLPGLSAQVLSDKHLQAG